MYIRFKDGKQKVVTLSYDDGVVFDIKLIEIMSKYGLKGTFNINTGLYLSEETTRDEWNGRMKLSEAKKTYSDSGNEIAVHALTHPFLEQLSEPEIIREIRTEYKNELKKEVDLEVQEELNQKKINDIKELMWSGFLLAFVVGLAVNQVTDIIGYLKGQITMESIWSTVAITGVLLLVCIVAYLYSFFSHAIRLLKSDKKKNEDLNNNETDC